MTIEEIKKKADELYPHAQIIDHNATGYDAFVKGAMWMQEQYEINEEKLDELAEKIFPYEYTTSLNASEEADYINDLREAFKKGYREVLKQKL